MTAAGARELAARLAAPLTDVKAIAARHDAVALFAGDSELRRDACARPCAPRPICRAPWRGCRCGAAARAIWAISATASRRRAPCAIALAKIPLAGEAVGAAEAITQGIAAVSRLADRLELLLVDEPPYLARDGGFIRAGVHAPLDEVRALAR